MLPQGYTTTQAGGLLILWRNGPNGDHACVTVLSDPCTRGLVEGIASRDTVLHPRREGDELVDTPKHLMSAPLDAQVCAR